MKTQYPEHEKLSGIAKETQFLGEFINWLDNKKMVIAEYNRYDELHPVYKPINTLLAEFKGIDLIKLEQEKLLMLENAKALNEIIY